MTAFPWLAGLVACSAALAIAAYLIVRVLRWADHALPEWLDTNSKDRCRCGVYESAHIEGRGCGDYRKASRLRLWWREHYKWRHIVGWVWLHLTPKMRWWIVDRYYKRYPGLCWCDLVDSAYKPEQMPEDFRRPHGCLCDVPLPTDAGVARPGDCYCMPPEPQPNDTSETGGTR